MIRKYTPAAKPRLSKNGRYLLCEVSYEGARIYDNHIKRGPYVIRDGVYRRESDDAHCGGAVPPYGNGERNWSFLGWAPGHGSPEGITPGQVAKAAKALAEFMEERDATH